MPDGFRSAGLINDGHSAAKHESVSRRIVGNRHLRIRERFSSGHEGKQTEKRVSFCPGERAELTFTAVAVLPKQNSVFGFCVPVYSTAAEGGDWKRVADGPHVELELYGNQFRFRSSDRASRKFKHKESIVL